MTEKDDTDGTGSPDVRAPAGTEGNKETGGKLAIAIRPAERVTALRGQAIAKPSVALKKRRRNEGAAGDESKNLTDSVEESYGSFSSLGSKNAAAFFSCLKSKTFVFSSLRSDDLRDSDDFRHSDNPRDSPPHGSDESEDLHRKVEEEKISKEIFEPPGHSKPGAIRGAGQDENEELAWARRHIPDGPAEQPAREVFRKTELRVRPPAEEARRRYRCRKLQEMRRGRSP